MMEYLLLFVWSLSLMPYSDFLHIHRCWMDCPQWTAMSQLPASIPTILPPKCRLTWGTAAPCRPMWPAPHGSHPVAVLSLPTAVTSLPHWLSRVWQPLEIPCTLSLPLHSDLEQEDRICGPGLPRKAIAGWTNVSLLIYLWMTCVRNPALLWFNPHKLHVCYWERERKSQC